MTNMTKHPPLSIVFAGSPDFATPALEALIQAGHRITMVYTKPDKPSGRGQKIMSSAVKLCAEKYQLPLHQPATLRKPEEHAYMQALQPDLMVVAAYGLILPREILAIPRYGCINIHGSLLPKWRGAAPIQRSVLHNDAQTGITIMQMNEGLDTGDMLKKAEIPITKEDTSQTLYEKLAQLGAKLLIETLNDLQENCLHPIKQNDQEATHAAKIQKEEANICWELSATEIDCAIRAFNPWPVCYSALENQTIRIWKAQAINKTTEHDPGTIINSSHGGIDVATGEGILRITELQLPGAKRLPVSQIMLAKKEWFSTGKKFRAMPNK